MGHQLNTENLANKAKNAAGKIKDEVANTDVKDVLDHPGATLKKSATTIVDAVQEVADEFKRSSKDATEAVKEYSTYLGDYAKRHPWRIAISLGAASLVLGFFLMPARRSSDQT
jgi:ElaB/YqjD/DUF883 family membrane-anchored ribosome-binding protein